MAHILKIKITVFSLPKENSVFLCTHYNFKEDQKLELLSARSEETLYFYPLKRKQEIETSIQLDLSGVEDLKINPEIKNDIETFQRNFDYSLLSYCNCANVLKFRCLNLFNDDVL